MKKKLVVKLFAEHAVKTFFTLSGFSVAVAYMSLVLKDLLSHYIISIPNLGFVIFAFFTFFSLLIGLQNGKLISVILSIPLFLSVAIVCSFIASSIYSLIIIGRINSSPFYISFFLALILFSANRRVILIILLMIPIINFFLQSWETFTGELFFPTIVAIHDITLNSEGWKIGEDEIRTKGLFQGPLHIVSMCLLALIASPYSLSLRLIMLCVTYLSGARLGLLISLILIMIYFASGAHTRSLLRFKFLLYFFTVCAGALFLISIFILLGFLSNERVLFMLYAFDFTSNASNLNRIVVWLFSLQAFLSYDAYGIFFGKFDEIRYLTEHGSTESDWLRLLVDNGLLGMLVYLIAVLDFIRRILKQNDSAKLVCLIALIISMFIFPSIGWLAGATGFWIIYFFQVNGDRILERTRLIS